MAYRIGNKFVSQEAYEAHQQREAIEAFATKEAEPVSEQTTTETARKPRTSDPLTSASSRFRAAKKNLDKVKGLHARYPDGFPSLDDAQYEYDTAKSDLSDLLDK